MPTKQKRRDLVWQKMECLYLCVLKPCLAFPETAWSGHSEESGGTATPMSHLTTCAVQLVWKCYGRPGPARRCRGLQAVGLHIFHVFVLACFCFLLIFSPSSFFSLFFLSFFLTRSQMDFTVGGMGNFVAEVWTGDANFIPPFCQEFFNSDRCKPASWREFLSHNSL